MSLGQGNMSMTGVNAGVAALVVGAANNGTSIDPVTNKIVLGNAVGAAGEPAQLLSSRDILLNAFTIRFLAPGFPGRFVFQSTTPVVTGEIFSIENRNMNGGDTSGPGSQRTPVETGSIFNPSLGSGDINGIGVADTFAPTGGASRYKAFFARPIGNFIAGSGGEIVGVEVGIVAIVDAGANTLIVRGFYFNPALTGAGAPSNVIAFENVVGNNVFNSLSGITQIGAGTPTVEIFQVNGSARIGTGVSTGERLQVNGTAAITGITKIGTGTTGTQQFQVFGVAIINGASIAANNMFNVTSAGTQLVRIVVTNTAAGASAGASYNLVNNAATTGMQLFYGSTTHSSQPNLVCMDIVSAGGLSFIVRAAGAFIAFGNNITTGVGEYARFIAGGNFGLGLLVPTATLHIKAGTAAAGTAPFKYTTGVVLTAPEDGAKEFDGTNEFITAAAVRYTLAKTLTATAVLDFPNTVAGTSSDLTIIVTGAADGDVVALGVPIAALLANGIFSAFVSAVNTVTVRFSNNDLALPLDPGSGTFRVSVIKY